MKHGKESMIHALEFGCEAPIRFFEHCSSCARFGDDCPDLALCKEVLMGKLKVVYNGELDSEDCVDATVFDCLAPLRYIEKTRSMCAHKGRCREEGLLIALLSGRKKLTYLQKTITEFPRVKDRIERAEGALKEKEEAVA